ncbi:2-hydroxyacid dehydrogenase [Planktothricoides raciborskii]|uniref:Glyoxylate/hydroxypyruvate reductase A n=1 Tax=Planktothricoides raciborskii FACHB-1370 TaxID=2949576 RepID=A0ABR8EH31_9CYAN|nr:glyoxylate/hydroxypyruvate reductase A [Planktothricoides raciborskii]MBD2544862.1 glyoxylate/hydroxypyruvate reductase A [Planktothricoides raciborskii FACHB-1370]MBD2583042.1 glyoxylate/hydroxypyruvate reductase A [Planktothricoides raciborskii FACHB-1261]
MAVLILTEIAPTDVWFSNLIAQLKQRQPDINLRVWPECGNLEDIEIVLAWQPPLGVMQNLPNLKLIISLGASVDRILVDPNLPDQIPIVRLVSRGKTLQMAQYVILAVLLFQRRFIDDQQLQRSRQWEYLSVPDAISFTVGILGLGFFGSTVATKLAAIGFPVRGWSRNSQQIEGVESFYGDEQFELFLSQCRAIVCVLPVTSETKGILSNETFSALPQGAYLINVGRGKHLVETDLLSALDSGQIAGACLDVFNTEPLPHDHPFWSHPRIIVTPHIAAEGQPDDVADFILETIAIYKTGQPLKYLVERNRGY